MSVSLWYTTESLYVDWQALIVKGEGESWRLARTSYLGTLNFGGEPTLTGDGELDVLNTWHHVVITQDLDKNERFMYVNGKQVGTTTAAPFENKSTPLIIGSNPKFLSSRSWDGMIDDIAIWDRALTSDEIESIWNGGTGASITSLIPEPSAASPSSP